MRLLLIDPLADRAKTWAKLLGSQDLRVDLATDGFYALTMLEWQRPQCVVCRSELADMSSTAFCAIVKQDRHLRGLEVILLPESEEERKQATSAGLFDRVMECGVGPETFRDRLLSPQSSTPVSARSREPAHAAAEILKGSLGDHDFRRLVRQIRKSGASGRLSLALETGFGMIIFHRGEVRHATYRKFEGSTAFTKLYCASQPSRHGQFLFTHLNEVGAYRKSIVDSLEQLLSTARQHAERHGTETSISGGGER